VSSILKKAGIVTAVTAASLLMASPSAMADDDDDIGATTGTNGILAGNVVLVPPVTIHVPIQVCGNTEGGLAVVVDDLLSTAARGCNEGDVNLTY
jgi:hypothetical protein